MIRDCVKVHKKQAEAIHRELLEAGLLAKDCKACREGEFVFFPITNAGALPKSLAKSACKKEVAPNAGQKRGSLGEVLEAEGALTKEESQAVVNSFDCLGDIAIIEVPQSLRPKQKAIARTIMELSPHIKVVARKDSPMLGRFRVRKLTVIAGEKRTTTVYRESGCSFFLDAAKVYFSVRLAHERLRVASLVRPKERVLALFAGVGPYAIVIARRRPRTQVVGIELNAEAVKEFRQNIRLNKTPNVKAILGDVKKIVPRDYKGWADRITMPLPHSAAEFLDSALSGANRKGCTVHFYGFAQTRDKGTQEQVADIYAPIVEMIRKKCAAARLSCRITNKRIVRPYAPYVVQAGIDFRVKAERKAKMQKK